jgi:hypothetical protein
MSFCLFHFARAPRASHPAQQYIVGDIAQQSSQNYQVMKIMESTCQTPFARAAAKKPLTLAAAGFWMQVNSPKPLNS